MAETLQATKNIRPLVHNLTNMVVMHITVNALLAFGASPIMAHEKAEMDDMLNLASALVLNIGTLDLKTIPAMRMAGSLAKKRGIPTVLDPVGAGASKLRTETSLTLLEEASPAVLRGNASEIMALSGADAKTKGVDSLHDSKDAITSAMLLAERWNCTVSVSGKDDIITDGCRIARISGGSPLMASISGMGCTSTALTAACVAGARHAGFDAFTGAAAAMAAMAEAGSNAAQKANGPGTFFAHFMDELYALSPEKAALRLAEISIANKTDIQ
ncbi:MAG: hydroxyethylthiazole kinase [Desulfovibrionaceae bacterium]|nr:hydroxyethylthiazole kinase [Desulfovibrionaceae bacterium]